MPFSHFSRRHCGAHIRSRLAPCPVDTPGLSSLLANLTFPVASSPSPAAPSNPPSTVQVACLPEAIGVFVNTTAPPVIFRATRTIHEPNLGVATSAKYEAQRLSRSCLTAASDMLS